jgi:hypothetical protein
MSEIEEIRGYSRYSSCKAELYEKYAKNSWFNEALGYLSIRYYPIERRVLETLRYVELAPSNASTFSFEYGSIIRDVGSTFSSVLDKLVRNTATKPEGRDYDIREYRKFLTGETENIDSITCQLATPFKQNLVIPFSDITNGMARIKWWEAYNDLKHSEIDNIQKGCLSNVIYSVSSLAVLYTLMTHRPAEGRLFPLIGYFKPLDKLGPFVFPESKEAGIP